MTRNDRAGADRRPLLLAGLGAACISASGILIKLADTGAATAAFYRCFLALPLLVALAVMEQRRRGPRPWAIRGGAFVAGLVLSVDLVLWNHAIAEVGAGIATVLGNLQVLFVALAAWVLFAERPHRTFLVALPVVLGGVVLVSGLIGTAAGGTHPLAGIGYGMATSVAYATFLLILRRTSAGTPHVAGRSPRPPRAPRSARWRSAWRSAGSACGSAGPRSAGCCCCRSAARRSAGC